MIKRIQFPFGLKPKKLTTWRGLKLRLALLVAPVILVAGVTAVSYSQAAACTVSATLVNSCRPWLGASVGDYPQVASDVKSQVLYHEQRIGRQIDIVHTYHPVGNNKLSSDDIYFANRANTILFANW